MKIVSIIVPCYNEEKTITLLLDAVAAQTVPHDLLEVVFADGNSTDHTVECIQRWCESHPDIDVRIVSNPKRIIPAGLNLAGHTATGEFIIRLDAHSVPNPDYVEQCLAVLADPAVQNAGGRWEIAPGSDHWMSRSIAKAAACPLGVGDAKYRYSEIAGPVDTVPFGAYRKSVLDRVGWYDETLLTNEDYDLNTRIRRTGGIVFFNPAIRCTYFARTTLGGLAKQYWRYGYWKVRMLQKDPKSIRLRQLIPPFFVAGLLLLILFSLFIQTVSSVLLLICVIYLAALLFVSIRAAGMYNDLTLLIGMPLAMMTMHISWGSAFLWSLCSLLFKKKPTQNNV